LFAFSRQHIQKNGVDKSAFRLNSIDVSITANILCQLFHSYANQSATDCSNSHAWYEQAGWNLTVKPSHAHITTSQSKIHFFKTKMSFYARLGPVQSLRLSRGPLRLEWNSAVRNMTFLTHPNNHDNNYIYYSALIL